jgi:hypothetical protein
MYLNEEEILQVEAFCKNEKMFEAVKKVLLAPIYEHGVVKPGEKHNPLVNGAFSLVAQSPEVSNEVLGAFSRAKWAGVTAVEGGFEELKKIKSKKAEDKAPAENEGV